MTAANPTAPDASSKRSALSEPVESLTGVGPTRARHLRALGVSTLGDLLEYFPRRYQFESAEKPVSQLVADQVQTVRGQVIAVNYIPSRPRPRFEATLDDGTEKLAVAWFNSAFLRRQIHPGMTLRVKGKVTFFRRIPKMVQPKWEVVDADAPRVDQANFRPIYPASQRLPSETIARIVQDNLDAALPGVEEWFDPELLERRRLMTRRKAYETIHRPTDMQQAMAARRRIVYDELMLMQLGLGISRRMRQRGLAAPIIRLDKLLDQRIRARFPFQLTDAQQNAIWEIASDIARGQPMNRLLQGDVGSGKTVVALYAMLAGVANKLQSALLAPTEVLAEQHYLTLSNLLRGSNVTIGLFTGRTKRQNKRALLEDLSEGKIHLAVGTQSLISEDIEFANLGLVVVDEQHKLGVRQRAVLKSKGLAPHYLVMTATPIPRTLALSFFADFDVSVIQSLPPGRLPIKTRWLRSARAVEAYEFIRSEVGAGRQAYIVLPRVEEDALDESKSVIKEHERLSKGPLSGLKLAILHGQMSTEEKQTTMSAFRDRQIDVLVATTVIEVGIDIPNATVMLIDNAEQFGLSQLHQLRGRVGRGGQASHCILISDAVNESAEQRMQAMVDSTDGFEIAEMDLKLRGPGEFFGTRQHGLPEFKLADLSSELALLQQAKEDALALLNDDPSLNKPAHIALRRALTHQLGTTLDLAQIG